MRRHTSLLCVLATFVGALFVPAAPAAARPRPLPVRFVDCGDVLNNPTSFKLGNDLDCTGNGFSVINGLNIKIDLGSHLLRGANTATGITLDSSNSGVTIRNGVISKFDDGIDVLSSDGNTFTGLTFSGITTFAMLVQSSNNLISANTFSRGAGVFLSDVAPTVAADANTVRGNVFDGPSLSLSGADLNVIENNTFHNGGIVAAQGNSGSSGNTFDSNNVLGSSSTGIALSGDDSDSNNIINNLSRGNGAFVGTQAGILVSDADSTKILRNTTNGNRGNGIDIVGSATNAEIADNTALGNSDNGISLSNSADGATLDGNVASNNGSDGIVAIAGASPPPAFGVTRPNTTNFNGFLNGLPVPGSNLGINALDGTGPQVNVANGNDVLTAGTAQCSDSLCAVPASPTNVPLALQTCGAAANVVLYNPLRCATGDAVIVQTSDSTVDLGQMFISSGNTAGLVVASANNVRVSNGYVVGAQSGVLFEGATGSFLTNTVVSNTPNLGLQLVQDGGSVPSATNTLTGVAVVGSSGDGVFLSGSDGNRLVSMTIASNGGFGLDVIANGLDVSSSNRVSTSRISGNAGDGVMLFDSTSNVLSKSSLIGNGDDGVHIAAAAFLASDNTLSKNTILGNLGNGVHLSGNNTDDADPGIGAARNHITANKISASNQNGLEIEPDADSVSNTVTTNSIRSSGGYTDGNGYGIFVHSDVTSTKVVSNVVPDNAQDGIYFEGGPPNGKVSLNKAKRNGFVATTPAGLGPLDDDSGLGILVGDGARGCGNVARGNDDPDQSVPRKLLKPC